MGLTDKNRDNMLLSIMRQLIQIREGLANTHLYNKFHFEYDLDKQQKFLGKMERKNKK